MDKFREEKHIQSYYRDTSFGSEASCATDCGAIEECSGKLWWWLLWLLAISQASAMSLLETGRGATWDLSVTHCICWFSRPYDFNGFECSYPGLHRAVWRIMNDLLSALCPRAWVRGGDMVKVLTTAKPSELCSVWHACARFDLCCCALADTSSSCHCCDLLYNNKIWLHFQFILLCLMPYIDRDLCLLSWRGYGKADNLSFTTYFSAWWKYSCPFLP